MDPIFAKTRHVYDSYSDFWKLVELSGFRTCYTDEMDLSAEGIYITSPFEPGLDAVVDGFKGRKRAKLVWWDLERPDHMPIPKEGPIGVVRSIVDRGLKAADQVWISDRTVAAMDPRLVYVCLGSHPGLYEDVAPGARYDLCHMSYAYGRREHMLRMLKQSGFSVAPAFYGTERSRILVGSKAILNLHQKEPLKVYAPLRFNVAAAFGVPILSEMIDDPYPLVPGESILMAEYNDLPGIIRTWLGRNDLLEMGRRAKETLTERFTFRRGVEEGVAKLIAA